MYGSASIWWGASNRDNTVCGPAAEQTWNQWGNANEMWPVFLCIVVNPLYGI